MRIAHINYSLEVGGAETVTAELCRRSRERGHTVTVISLSSEGAVGAMLRNEGFDVRVQGESASLLARARALYGTLRDFRPDVVHMHNSGATILAAPVARAAGVRAIICTRHGITHAGESAKRLAQFGLASRLCSRVVGVCEAVSVYLRGLRFVDASRVVTIYNGAAEAPITAPSAPLSHEGLTFTWVGRFSKPKDPETLLRAIAEAHQTRADLRLWFVGDGDLRARTEALCDELNVRSAVTFFGTRRDIGAILAASDVFVLSSLSEGLPISLLEAMAASKPALATDVGAMREVIDGARCGLVVPPANAGAMRDAILSCANNDAQLNAWRDAARAHYERHFTPERMVERYLALYEECLQR